MRCLVVHCRFSGENMFAVYFVAAHLNLGMTLSALGRHEEAEGVWSVYMVVIMMYVCIWYLNSGAKTLCYNQF